MTEHREGTPGWRRRRQESKRARDARTGDTPQKKAEPRKRGGPPSVKEIANRIGVWFGGG
jgi:hypothetical protein